MIRLLNFPNTLLWRTCCFRMVRWVQPFGRSDSTTWYYLLEGMSAPRRWLKISEMYTFPVLWLREGLFLLIWMSSVASLATYVLSWSINLEVADVGLRVVVGNAVFVNCTGHITIVFFYSIFQTFVGFCYLIKVTDFFWTGWTEVNMCLQPLQQATYQGREVSAP